MRLPEVDVIPTSRDVVSTFLGYCHNDKVNQYAGNQFYDMKNLASNAYPALSTRQQRAVVKQLEKGNGLYAGEKLIYVDGGRLYYDFQEVCQVEDSEKQFAVMGAYLVVFPDDIMMNTRTGEVEKLGLSYETENDILFTMCKIDGTPYDYYTGATEPSRGEEGESAKYWLDISVEPHVLKMWSTSNNCWNSVPSSYVKIQECPSVLVDGSSVYCKFIEPMREEAVEGDYWCDLSDDTLYCYARQEDGFIWREEERPYQILHKDFGERIKEYDGIDISGCIVSDDINTNMIIYGVGRDYIIVSAMLDSVCLQGAADRMRLVRKIPEMDFVCELDNRLWGCSSENHEIYACRLGDPSNWYSYAGLASDAYAVTVGSQGDFTGCIPYLGYVYFFKEDCIHQIYGTEPSNYTITTIKARGCQKGSEKSLCIVDEVLYYKSPEGVCRFDGTIPQEISEDLGTEQYAEAVGGVLCSKYYVCMKNIWLRHVIFVYDTRLGMWHKEDEKRILAFANSGGGLYYIDEEQCLGVVNRDILNTVIVPGMLFSYPEGRSVIAPGRELTPGMVAPCSEEEVFGWYAETNIMGMDMPDNKYVSNITMRLQVEKAFRVYMQYDSSGDWEKVLDISQVGKRSMTIPIRVKRCDHFKIRFEGEGAFRLFSYAKTIEQGSEW